MKDIKNLKTVFSIHVYTDYKRTYIQIINTYYVS